MVICKSEWPQFLSLKLNVFYVFQRIMNFRSYCYFGVIYKVLQYQCKHIKFVVKKVSFVYFQDSSHIFLIILMPYVLGKNYFQT